MLLATGRPNDVFADRDGNIARKSKEGWQNRGANGWEKPGAADVRQKIDSKDVKRPAAGPAPASARQRIDSANLNRAAASWQRGTSREMRSPTRSRPAPTSRPTSGSRPRPRGR